VGPPTVGGGNRGPPSLASTGNRGPPSMVSWPTRGPRPMTVTVGPPVFRPWVLLHVWPDRGPPVPFAGEKTVGPPPMVGWPTRGSRPMLATVGPPPLPHMNTPPHPLTTLGPWGRPSTRGSSSPREGGPRGSSSDLMENFDYSPEPWVLPSTCPPFSSLLRTVGPPDRGSSLDSVVFRVNRGSPLGS
jgi:hypothetical protein